MQLSKKAEYAVRAVAILGARTRERSIQAHEMAQIGDIPQKFLEQILLVLKKAGIASSKRGVGGGYRISRDPRLITVAEVIACVDGEINPLPANRTDADFPGAAGIRNCFSTASKSFVEQLEKTTFEDLLAHEHGDCMVGFGI